MLTSMHIYVYVCIILYVHVYCVCVTITQEQYQFVFEAVLTFLESFETYSNFKWQNNNKNNSEMEVVSLNYFEQ